LEKALRLKNGKIRRDDLLPSWIPRPTFGREEVSVFSSKYLRYL